MRPVPWVLLIFYSILGQIDGILSTGEIGNFNERRPAGRLFRFLGLLFSLGQLRRGHRHRHQICNSMSLHFAPRPTRFRFVWPSRAKLRNFDEILSPLKSTLLRPSINIDSKRLI